MNNYQLSATTDELKAWLSTALQSRSRMANTGANSAVRAIYAKEVTQINICLGELDHQTDLEAQKGKGAK